MSEVPKIESFAEIISPFLNGGQLVSYQSRYLTKPGENYGSVMLAVTATIKRSNGQLEQLPLVAKLPPITNELYWEIFQPQRTCITENAIYKYVRPALRSLQAEANVSEEQLFDGFPRYFGSRISLNAATTAVDRDAVLLQENLQSAGFQAGNRHKMYDLPHARMILDQIAQYHALLIALRIKKPTEFDSYVRPYVKRFNMNATMPADVKAQMQNDTLKEVEYATNNNEKSVERIKQLLHLYDEFQALPEAHDGPYTTVVHCDMWINNLMIQYDEVGLPQKLKIVDFQIAQYESLAHDIVFFLLSSVEVNVLQHHFEELLLIYFKSFVACLQQVGVSTAIYTFEGFLTEVKRVAPIELPHALFMTKIILADTSTMPEDFKDMDINVISKNVGAEHIIKRIGDILRIAQHFKFMD